MCSSAPPPPCGACMPRASSSSTRPRVRSTGSWSSSSSCSRPCNCSSLLRRQSSISYRQRQAGSTSRVTRHSQACTHAAAAPGDARQVDSWLAMHKCRSAPTQLISCVFYKTRAHNAHTHHEETQRGLICSSSSKLHHLTVQLCDPVHITWQHLLPAAAYPPLQLHTVQHTAHSTHTGRQAGRWQRGRVSSNVV